MDLNDLHVLLAVAEERSFTKAAERLGYVQSNVTSRVKKLEQELNVDLFIRHPKGVHLTNKGKAMVEYAVRITSLALEAKSVVSDTGFPKGRLNLGAVETLTASGLVEAIATYHRQFPDVELTLSSGTSDSLKTSVSMGEMDAVFVTGPLKQDDLVSERQWDDGLLAVGATVDLSSPREPWIVFSRGCSYRAALENWLNSAGLSEARFFVVGTLEALQRSVLMGLGNTVLPKSTVARLQMSDAVRVRDLPHPYGYLSVHLARRRDSNMTSALREFINLMNLAGDTLLV